MTQHNDPPPVAKNASQMTAPRFASLKGSGQKLTMVTAYDYPFAPAGR